ncbi:MAG: iron complex outermembrane recepter protein [Candidatus Electronema aureum]|uniref:Iron complex outermembrane recepter protein n=1 Tax=Candidatus Electronema aureum TaxID=2005002 RepID=A0A521G3N3_9BACT|nr:MAG: iron complex outermembrane recepter protein [Candidatus Electronema aureum]
MRTKRYRKAALMGLTAAALAGQAAAAETEMAEVLVTGDKLITPSMQASETVYTGSEITPKGIELQGAKASTSVYSALDMLPGINVESPDSTGLAAEMSSVRVRGVRSSMGAMTVEGMPNHGGNPIGPRDYLYDMENMRGISIYKGAIPGDIGTGIGSRGGAIELRPDWPGKGFGLRFKQSLGSNSYTRSYVRLDSCPAAETGTAVSGSYSFSQADKWRGEGELGPRNNANVSLSQPLSEKADVKLWYNHNDLDQHLYRPLTWKETQNLSANYEKDFNAARSGLAEKDFEYYDYNRGTYENNDLLAILTLRASDSLRFTVKPYHTREDVEILQGVATVVTPSSGASSSGTSTSAGSSSSGGAAVPSSTYSVQKRLRDIKHTGMVAEAMAEQGDMKGTLGYHLESSDSSILTENYALTGSGLAYRGYGRMTVGEDNDYINSPYVKLAGTRGAFDWQAGLKYFHYTEAASKGYISDKTAPYSLKRAADIDQNEKTLDIWLPTAAAAWRFSNELEGRASYGKTFIRPYSYLPLHNIYSQNRATFLAKGISLQDLFAGYDFEQADIFDIGVRWTSGMFEIAPTFFYGKHKNLLTTIYDPRVDLNYQQNVGEATGYGLDVEMNAYLSSNLTAFINPTWTSMTYDEDLSYAGKRRATEGNQVIDTPEWMVKTGLIWSWQQFELAPMLRYLGERYADAENRSEVDSAFVADLRMSYLLPPMLHSKEMKLSLELNNLLDEEYISSITGSDDSRGGQSSFYQGAPFSAMLIFSVRY